MTYHAFRQRGAYGNRIPGKIDPKIPDLNPRLWYDFSDESTLFTDAGATNVSSDGDAIYQINDKSGNNNHCSQITLANRALYKTGIQNSLSAMVGDGSNDYYMLPNLTLNNYTLLFVVVFSTKADWQAQGGWDTYPSTPRQACIWNIETDIGQTNFYQSVGGTGAVQTYSGLSNGVAYLSTIIREGTTVTNRLNGSILGTNTVGAGSFTTSQHSLLNHYYSSTPHIYSKCPFLEYRIYGTNLNSDQVWSLESEINTKWDIW